MANRLSPSENVRPKERRVLAVAKHGYPAGTPVEVFYRSAPYVAVRIIGSHATFGGIYEERELAQPPLQVVSV